MKLTNELLLLLLFERKSYKFPCTIDDFCYTLYLIKMVKNENENGIICEYNRACGFSFQISCCTII